MSNITNFEEQPPESPLDVLSRVATMVEKSQTSPTAAAALSAAKSVDNSTAILNYPTIVKDHKELHQAHSPPPSEAHQTPQTISRILSNKYTIYQIRTNLKYWCTCKITINCNA